MSTLAKIARIRGDDYIRVSDLSKYLREEADHQENLGNEYAANHLRNIVRELERE